MFFVDCQLHSILVMEVVREEHYPSQEETY
jgi:hypothetical protein